MNTTMNSSTFFADHPIYRIFFSVYFFQGLFLLLANGLIFGAIAMHKSLRKKKEYIVIAGLALVDGANGFGLLTAGLFRNLMLLDGTADNFVSRISCLLTPWNVVFALTDCLCHLYMLTISIDRFIAVKFPMKYYSFTANYAYTLVGCTFLFEFVNVAIGICTTLKFDYPEKPKICYTSHALNEYYYMYHSWLAIVSDVASIVIYIFIIRICRNQAKTMPMRNGAKYHRDAGTEKFNHVEAGEDHSVSSQQLLSMKIQMQVTRTLAISSLFTFLFFCLPHCFKILIRPFVNSSFITAIIPYTFIINQINPMANFFIYTSRQRDLREAIKDLVTLKILKKKRYAREMQIKSRGTPAKNTDCKERRTT